MRATVECDEDHLMKPLLMKLISTRISDFRLLDLFFAIQLDQAYINPKPYKPYKP
jgi:hypothetical protein